jgi:hypothetical protein
MSDAHVSINELRILLHLDQDIGHASSSGTTTGILLYCWKNPMEALYRFGTQIAVAGYSLQGNGGEIPRLDYPGKEQLAFDRSLKYTDGRLRSMLDVERKLLTWALNVTFKSTQGWASIEHIGPEPQCLQCRTAVMDFKKQRPRIALSDVSTWYSRDPYGYRGEIQGTE